MVCIYKEYSSFPIMSKLVRSNISKMSWGGQNSDLNNNVCTKLSWPEGKSNTIEH